MTCKKHGIPSGYCSVSIHIGKGMVNGYRVSCKILIQERAIFLSNISVSIDITH